MHLLSPPNFAVTVVSNCSRVLQSFQEKSRTKAMQNFGINKVHLWSLWKWWILTFQLQQRPDEQGWSTCSFELICCYLFTRAESVPSSCKNKNMLRLWWLQFGPIKYIHHHFFISLFFIANFTGYSRLLGEETSRNHQAYKERPPRHHNIIRNKGCEEVRLN